jgi:DNA repair exonuclease SbcCD ATPase subunit
MPQAPLDRLVKLRKSRVDNALRDLAALQEEKVQVSAKLDEARRQHGGLVQSYLAREKDLAAGLIHSFSDLAAIQGDLLAIREQIHAARNHIADVEEELDGLARRIVAARTRWREFERAHDRCAELSTELAEEARLAALAIEEFADS